MSRAETVKQAIAYAPAIVWAAFLLFIGGRSDVPTVETPLPLDKAAHFVTYGILGCLTTAAWLKVRRPRRLFWVLLLAIAVGAADELNQRTVSHRSADIKDWLADIVGISVAAAALLQIRQRRGPGQDERNHVV